MRPGGFHLPVAAGDGHYLRATHALYAPSGDLAISVSLRENLNVVVRMGRATIPLEPLVVAVRSRDRLSGFRERAAGRGLGHYILRAEIERRNPIRPTDLFKLESGVRLERVDIQGVSTEVLNMRSFGEQCAPAIYIDGLEVPVGGGTLMTSIDDFLTVEEIEGVEIYRSGATTPWELHVARDACGVIAFWTRPVRRGPLTWKRVGIGAVLAGMMFFVFR